MCGCDARAVTRQIISHDRPAHCTEPHDPRLSRRCDMSLLVVGVNRALKFNAFTPVKNCETFPCIVAVRHFYSHGLHGHCSFGWPCSDVHSVPAELATEPD
jgi:hypothetical protein